MQKIIVTSDLSERSRPAMKRAVALAQASGATLIVLSVVNDDVPDALAQPVVVGAKSILTDQLKEDAGGLPLRSEIQVTLGDPLAVIGEAVASSGADLLVMGKHRRRAFLDQIRETTMEHIIRSSRLPVLLVTTEGAEPYHNVLSGVAYSDNCTSVLHALPKVAPDADVTLFHAHDVSFRAEAERDFETWKTIHRLPEDTPLPVFFEGRPQDAIDALMRAKPYDLLAIGGHTRADGGRYFVGRLTANLIRTPPCDLLIAKSPAKTA
ncbi:MAG: universal stress protein [Pseudomonadota bacterium]